MLTTLARVLADVESEKSQQSPHGSEAGDRPCLACVCLCRLRRNTCLERCLGRAGPTLGVDRREDAAEGCAARGPQYHLLHVGLRRSEQTCFSSPSRVNIIYL